MKKLLLLLFFVGAAAFGQDTFTSTGSGNWNSPTTWTGQAADADGIPDADDNVIIAATHTVTLDANSACNNLTLQGVGSGTRLAIGTNVLEVNGTLNGDGTSLSTTLITTGATGWLRFVGNSRVLIGTSWAANTPELACEIALTAGQIGTATTALKAKRINIASGTFSIANDVRPDSNVANTGVLFIQNDAVLITTKAISRTGTVNTPFGALTINGTGKIIINGTTATPLPAVVSGFPVYTFSPSAEIEYQGGTQTIGDINYPNLTISAGTKTWTPSANRTITGNLNITGGIFAFGNGVRCTVAGNITVAAGAAIGPSSSANQFYASGTGRIFTLNGTARITRSKTQSASMTTNSFDDTYTGFGTYIFGPNSWLSFRNPTSSAAVEFWVGPPSTGAAYANVEFAVISSTSLAATYTFKGNTEITGKLAVPSVATTPAAQTYDFGAYTLKIGGGIQLAGDNLNSGGQPVRTYTMGTSTVEFNGSAVQCSLGGANLPSSFYNLTINNSKGALLASNVSVSNTMSLTTGVVTLGANTLTAATISGGSATAYVDASGTGELRKSVSATGAFTLPVGDAAVYSPVNLNILGAGSFTNAYVGAKVTAAKDANNGSTTNYLNRTWTLSQSGITTPVYDADFTYAPGDVAGTESAVYLAEYVGTWLLGGATNADTHVMSGSGFTAFGSFTGGENGALPVELTTFTARAQGSRIMLSWATATETNNYGFEVEKRSNGAWNKVGFVEGAGTSASPKSYQYVDAACAGTSSYRLKQIDRDGKYTYSNVVEVAGTLKPEGFELAQNYPNPFNPATTIRFAVKQSERATLRVYDVTGREVIELFNDMAEAGQFYTVNFNAAHLSSGMYIYVLQTASGMREVKKMQLLK